MKRWIIRLLLPPFLVAAMACGAGCTTTHSEIREDRGVKYVCSWTETWIDVDKGSLRCYPVDGQVNP